MRKRLLILSIFICWFFLLMYPNPLLLGRSIYRVFVPPLDPLAVQALITEAPENNHQIESFVLAKIPYSYDWETYRVPWYFPSVEEVLQQQRGDCKSRFAVLASLLTALDIPYQHRISLTHIWVDYLGKTPTPLENEAASFFVHDGETRTWQLPAWDLKDSYLATKKAYWDVMPVERKTNLILGIACTAIFYLLSEGPSGRKTPAAANFLGEGKHI